MRLPLFAVALAVATTLAVATYGLLREARTSDARNFAGDERLTIYREDPRTIWRYRPGASLVYNTAEFSMRLRLNEDGLRGPPASLADGALTVLFVGDSFTFGWGVQEDERFADVLSHRLIQMVPRRNLRFINAGLSSFAFDQQLLILSELMHRYHPSVVVQGLYWMQIRSSFSHEERRSPEGRLQAIVDRTVTIDDGGVLRQRSDAALGAGDWVSYLRGSTRNEDLWRRTERLIDESAQVVADGKAGYMPFLIPTNVEVGGTNWAALGWTSPTPPDGVDLTQPRARLARMFGRRGIDAIDLAPQFPSAPDAAAPLYYPKDGHWTPAGHATAAGILLPYVLRSIAERSP